MGVVEMVSYNIKERINMNTTEPNTTWTKDQVVEESCHFQVVVLPVSAVTVICHHQQNGRTSTLIHMLSLGVPLACLVCCQRRCDVTRALANPSYTPGWRKNTSKGSTKSSDYYVVNC